MIVYNYGLPLSGTRWTNAVLRAVLDLHGVPFRSVTPPQASLLPMLRQAVDSGTYRWQVLILQTHDWSDEISTLLARAGGHSVAFAALRDPRDVCAALMSGTDSDPDKAVAETDARVAWVRPMLRESHALGLRYESAVKDPAAFALAIADALDLRLDAAAALRIAAQTEHAAERHAPGCWRQLPSRDRERIAAALGGAVRALGYRD